MLRRLPIRVLLALSMMLAMSLVVPAHHFGGEMLHASTQLQHADAAHHDADGCGDDQEQPHDSSHCSICIFAAGLMVVAMVDVIIPHPELADQRQAFEPIEALTQIQPAPAAPRGPPLA